MKTVPTSLSDRLGQPTQAPRFLYRFFHVQSLVDYPFSRDFASGAIVSATNTYLVVADPPTGNTQTVVPEQGTSTIGTFILPMLDLGGEITKQLSSPGAGLTATISAGNATIPASLAGGLTAAYPPFGTVQVDTERIRYFTLTDSEFGTPTRVCSRGVDGTTAAAHTAPSSVQNGEQIRKGQRVQVFVGDDSVGFAQYMSLVKMQVQERGQREPGVYTVTAQDIQRDLRRFAFLDAAPDTSSTTNTLTRQGHPLTLLLQVWTTTSGGGNGAYDQGDGRGAGIPQALVAVASIEALRAEIGSADVYRYLFRAPIEVKPWSEQLLKTLNCYPFVTQSGTLSVKRLVASGTAVASLTMDTILAPPRWVAGDPFIVNQLTVFYDFDEAAAPGQYATQEIFSSEGSVAKYGRTQPFVIEGPGIRSANSGAAIALNRATRFFERYADPPPSLVVEAHYQHLDVDIGDTVSVTHPFVPDLRKGTLGLTNALFEVTDVRPIFTPAEGPPRVVMTLLHTGGADLPPAPTSSRHPSTSAFYSVATQSGTVSAGAVSSSAVQSGAVGTRHLQDNATTVSGIYKNDTNLILRTFSTSAQLVADLAIAGDYGIAIVMGVVQLDNGNASPGTAYFELYKGNSFGNRELTLDQRYAELGPSGDAGMYTLTLIGRDLTPQTSAYYTLWGGLSAGDLNSKNVNERRLVVFNLKK